MSDAAFRAVSNKAIAEELEEEEEEEENYVFPRKEKKRSLCLLTVRAGESAYKHAEGW